MPGEKTMNRELELKARFIKAFRWDPHDNMVWRAVVDAYTWGRTSDFSDERIDVEAARETLLALSMAEREEIEFLTERYYELLPEVNFEPGGKYRPEYDTEYLEVQGEFDRLKWDRGSWLCYAIEALDDIRLYSYAGMSYNNSSRKFLKKYMCE